MHLEILDKKRIELLGRIESLSFITAFKMGGGTALSLQLGLRYSYDFDFFTKEHFNTKEVVSELKDMFGDMVEITNISERVSTVDTMICGVQVSFFEYVYQEIGDCVELNEYPEISLLSIRDIACMKSVAIVQRGTRKDFFDLYFLLKDPFIKDNLHLLIKEKYKDKNLLSNFYQSMTYFADAERDVLPKSFVEYSWADIKKFFLRYSRDYLHLLNGLD